MKCPSCEEKVKTSEIEEKKKSTWGNFKCPNCGVWLLVNPKKFKFLLIGSLMIGLGGPFSFLYKSLGDSGVNILSISLFVVGMIFLILAVKQPNAFIENDE